MVADPDGEWHKDERRAWFRPPPWAESQFPDAATEATAAGSATPAGEEPAF
ncbi:hypothetical protein ABZ815_49085 [Nonomuraea sp. NPDC047529]|uniref:hypothetical protein n=1 Tax=Nonomuraea sp. NPDC047529 TaxID=3155623 RepID=UPI0033C9D18D